MWIQVQTEDTQAAGDQDQADRHAGLPDLLGA